MQDSFEGLDRQQHVATLEDKYGRLNTEELLEVVINHEFKGRVAVLSSFGIDSSLVLSRIAKIDPATPVIFTDTNKHFPETLEHIEATKKHFGLTNIISTHPDSAYIQKHDGNDDLWERNSTQCCWARKVRPLEILSEELGLQAVITGVKHYQTENRANMTYFENGNTTIRINPLIYWTREQVQAELESGGFPVTKLFPTYRSVGCMPCTKPFVPGRDERESRWAGQAKTECGLNLTGGQSYQI